MLSLIKLPHCMRRKWPMAGEIYRFIEKPLRASLQCAKFHLWLFFFFLEIKACFNPLPYILYLSVPTAAARRPSSACAAPQTHPRSPPGPHLHTLVSFGSSKFELRGTLTRGIGDKVWIKQMLEFSFEKFYTRPIFENGSYFEFFLKINFRNVDFWYWVWLVQGHRS